MPANEQKQSQPPAAGEAAHTFCPTLPFKVGPIESFGPGMWKTDIRDALNVKLCAVIERDFTPKENVRLKAAFIVTACNERARLLADKAVLVRLFQHLDQIEAEETTASANEHGETGTPFHEAQDRARICRASAAKLREQTAFIMEESRAALARAKEGSK